MIDGRDESESPSRSGNHASAEGAVEAFDIFPWSRDFETGVKFMDVQHQALVRLLNSLARKLVLQTGAPSCDEVLRELSDYAIYHFAAEEGLMRQVLGGDALELGHLQAHREFVEEIARLRDQAATNPEVAGIEKVVAFLSHWLAQHILDVDRRMAMVVQAVQAGTALAEAKAAADRAMSGGIRKLIEAVLGMYDILSSRTLHLMREVIERQRIEGVLRDSQRSLREQKEFLSAIFENALDAAVLMNSTGVITGWNSQAQRTFGWSREEAVGRLMNETIIPARDCAAHVRGVAHVLSTGEGPLLNRRIETFALHRDGHEFPVELSITPIKTADGYEFSAFIRDISERKSSESHDRLRSDVLEKLAHGADLPTLLDILVRGIEAELPDCIASILLVDEEGRLRHGAAPGLPASFCAAIDGLPVGDGVGSCGTAAFRGELVVVEDIRCHPYWQGYRELTAGAGVAACWSQPVFDAHGTVVATFAVYRRTPQSPGDQEIAALVQAANLASVAIARHSEEKKLRMAMHALETARESVYWIDENGRMLYVNSAAEQELGYTADELRRMTLSDIDPNVPAALRGADDETTRRPQAGGLRHFVTQHRHRDGHLIPVEIHAGAFEYDGKSYSMSIAHDISERLAAEETLRRSEAKFSAMFNLAPDPMALTRLADGVFLDVSHSYAKFFGYQREEMIGRSTMPGDLGLWVKPEHRQLWRERMERDGEVAGFETPLRRKDGSLGTVLISGKIVDMDGERCVIVVLRDITEQKQHAEHLEEIAHHDPLTGLPNRLLLADRLRQAIARGQRAGTRIAVCYLDLDGFKEVNDGFGHQVGDRLLVEVANRLLGCVRGGDTVARLGGDEFVVLLSDLTGDEEWALALERLLLAISATYVIDDRVLPGISASIGVTVFPNDAVDPDTLVRHADHAMYAAKQAGKNRYQMFDTRHEQRIEARQATLRGLAEALKAGQFRLHYQPKVDCRQGRVGSAEALIRWQHPTLGLLSPAEFVPLIEDTDLAPAVGEWVIREALSQMVRWRAEGLDLRVSVNAFVHHLLQPDFVPGIAAILAQYPALEPDCLQFEIVESTALMELDTIRQVVEDCGRLGIVFALDDFGTGYSTLAHLRHLPATEIKIDQSFVGQMLARPEDLCIVEAVIGLGRAFGRTVVAEGVETTDHIVRLLALGCDVMQGYALARPMPGADIPRWIHEFRPEPIWYRPADRLDQA